MKTRARAAALPVWALVGTAGLSSSLAVSAVHAAGSGCLGSGLTNLAAVWGTAGLGFAVSTLLLVCAVPSYRTLGRALGATAALVLSVYALLAFIMQAPACA